MNPSRSLLNKNWGLLLFSLLFFLSAAYAQPPQYVNTSTLGSSNSFPLNAASGGINKCQWLFAPGEFINSTIGNITKIYLRPSAASSSVTYSDLTIKIGYTTLTSLSSGVWVTSGMQTCYYAPNTTFTSVTANNWLPIQLQSSFFYDYSRYIIIEISQASFSGTGLTINQWSPGGSNRRAFGNISSSTSLGSDFFQCAMGVDILPAFRYDAGVRFITKPVGPIPPSIDTVKAFIMNYGRDTLKTVALKWSVDNALQTAPASWSGSLTQSGASGQLTFGTYNFSNGIHTIKAWTHNPNGFLDSNAGNDTAKLILYSCMLTGGSYVIDPAGNGDFLSFNAALDRMKSCGITGAVTFRVKPGTYNEQLSIPPILGASSTNTITFESYNLDSSTVILTYNATAAANNYVIKLDGADYVSFNKITIKANGASFGRAVYILGGADYNSFSNNKILSLIGPSTSTNICCIYFDNSLDNHNSIQNNFIAGGYHGIYLCGTSTIARADFNVVKNNIVKDFYNTGIYAYYQTSPEISGNLIENSFSSSNCYGLQAYYLYDLVKIEKNKVNLSGTISNYCMNLYYLSGSSANTALIANNCISQTGPSIGINYGMNINGCSYLNIYHNSVNITATSLGSSRAIFITFGSDINIQNNIFAASGNGYAAYYATPGAIVASDYNDLFSNGPYVGCWGSTNYVSLANWKTAFFKDAHSVSSDPYFNSNTDLHASATILDSAALSLPMITTDIDNVPRNPIKPDIGAYEFVAFNYDAGITAIIEPSPPCHGVSSNVIVKLKNYGLYNITSTKIKWAINDSVQIPFNITGSLAKLKDTNVVIGTKIFYFGTIYKIKVWTDSINSLPDQNHRNDTLTLKAVTTALSGTYRIGAVGRDYASFNAAVNDLKLRAVCGKITFLVDPGTYTEQISIPAIYGASDNKTITFRSANGDSTSVILTYAATSTATNYTVQLNGADYIRFEKMTIKSTGTNYVYVVDISGGADHNIFKNNIIQTIVSTSSNAVPIYMRNSSNNYNIIENNRIENGYYGILLYAPSTTLPEKGNVIRNNKILRFYYTGICSYSQDSLEISNNLLSNNSTINCYGIYCYYNFNNCRFINNQVQLNSTNSMYGMALYYLIGTADKIPLVANNFISIIGSNTMVNHGLYLNNCRFNNIYHNSVNLLNGSATSRCLSLGGVNNDLNVCNNILVNSSTGYAIYLDATSVLGNNQMFSDYNDLYSKGTNLGYYGTAPVADLWAWQLVSSKDQNSISSFPSFTSSTNLHLKSYSVFSLKNPLPEVPNDIDGQARNKKKPIIGADERPTIANDAGISGFVYPKMASCDGMQDIVVVLSNFGTNPLTRVEIHSSVNGIILPTKYFTGLLNYGQDTTVFIGSRTLVAGTSYTIIATTLLPNGATDYYAENNSDTLKNIILYPFPLINSTRNDSICSGTQATLAVSSLNSSHFFWYDSLFGGTLLSEADSLVTPNLNSNRTYYVEAGAKGNPDSLITSKKYSSGFSEMGYMFNVQAINTDIVIDSFSVQSAMVNGIAMPIAVFYRKGGYIGFESDSLAWTFLGADTVISTGISKFVNVAIGGLKIKVGDTIGFYVSSTDINVFLTYSDISKTISDNYLTVSCGTKAFYPFDSYFESGKTWNGKLFFSTGSLCKSARMPVEAVIKPSPAKDLGSDVTVCSGKTVVLKTNPFHEFLHVWKQLAKPDTLSVADSFIADSSNTYVLYTQDQCGNSVTDTISTLLRPNPKANFSVNDSDQCLKGNIFDFTNKSTISNGIISGYSWNFGDSLSDYGIHANHTFALAGSYMVKLKAVSSYGCYDSQSNQIIVYPQPKANFIVNDSDQCLKGNSFVFTDGSSVINSSISGWTWDFADLVKDYNPNAIHSFVSDNSYQVKLSISTRDGCTDSISKIVVVFPQPKAAFTVNDTSQCLNANSFVSTNHSNIKSGILNYQWKMGNGATSSNKEISYSYPTSGIYKLQLNVGSDQGCMDSVYQMLMVSQPAVYLGKDTTLKHNEKILLDAAAGMDSYLWSNNATTQQITVDTSGIGDVGTKKVWARVGLNGCYNTDTILVHFVHNKSISENSNQFAVTVYPNPATNEIIILTSIPAGKNIKISLLNEYGRLITEVFNGANTAKPVYANVKKLASGLYFVKIETDTGSRFAKLVIMK